MRVRVRVYTSASAGANPSHLREGDSNTDACGRMPALLQPSVGGEWIRLLIRARPRNIESGQCRERSSADTCRERSSADVAIAERSETDMQANRKKTTNMHWRLIGSHQNTTKKIEKDRNKIER